MSVTGVQGYWIMVPAPHRRHAWQLGGVWASHALIAKLLFVHTAGHASQYGGRYAVHASVT